MTDSRGLEQALVRPEYGLGVCGPVLLQVWEHSTPDEGAREAVTMARALGRAGHPRTGTIIVVSEGSLLPSSEARRMLADLPHELGEDAGCAMIREGAGFRASAVRAVLTGISLLSRKPFAYEVYGDVPSAAHWLCGRLDGALDVDTLAAAVQTLRGRIG